MTTRRSTSTTTAARSQWSQHLVAAGYRSIAFITGPERQLRRQRTLARIQRCAGQQAAACETDILHGDFTEESGSRAARQICEASNARARYSRPTT